MRLAIITPGALPVPAVRGGAVENLIEILLNENEKNHQFDFSVVSIWDEKAILLAKKYKFTEFHFIKSNSFFFRLSRIVRSVFNRLSPIYVGNQFIAKVLKTVDFDSFDAIIIENAPQFSVVVKRTYPDIPVLSHLHNRYLFPGCRFGAQILSAIDWHLGVSHYICREIEALAGKKLENTHCLHNGIDVVRFTQRVSEERRTALRKRLGIRESDFVFIFSGRLVANKGIFELLEAFDALKKEMGIANLKLLVLGATGFSGSESPRFRLDGVVFSGFVNYEEIHSYYTLGDVAILPSLVDEAFGLTCAESLCSGLPTIISDAGGMPEIVDANSAVIVPRGNRFKERLASAMKLLFCDETLRKKIAVAARERGKFFSKERYWDNFVKFIQTL